MAHEQLVGCRFLRYGSANIQIVAHRVASPPVGMTLLLGGWRGFAAQLRHNIGLLFPGKTFLLELCNTH